MAWQIEFSARAKKNLASLDRAVAKRITSFLRERLAELDDPRTIAEPLKGSKLGAFWRYRVGDYRIIASIDDQVVQIDVVRIGHRREVYR